ncbi:MAG: antitoxin HicB [Nocardioides sp.]
MSTYTVRAKRWSGGWELHIDGEGVTQCRTLADAERQVRDYLSTVHDRDHDEATVLVVPDLGGIEVEVEEVREATAAAAAAQRAAAERSRDLARRLRDEAGLSVSDAAAVLGVSRGRVSQLVS